MAENESELLLSPRKEDVDFGEDELGSCMAAFIISITRSSSSSVSSPAMVLGLEIADIMDALMLASLTSWIRASGGWAGVEAVMEAKISDSTNSETMLINSVKLSEQSQS